MERQSSEGPIWGPIIQQEIDDAVLYGSKGNYHAACISADKAVRHAKEKMENSETHFNALLTFAITLGKQGDNSKEAHYHKKSAYYYEKAADISKNWPNRLADAEILYKLGNARASYGDFAAAILPFQEAVKYNRTLNRKEAEADVLHNLGACFNSSNRYTDAIQCLKQALQLNYTIPNRKIKEADCLLSLGFSFRKQGNFAESALFYERGARLYQDLQENEKEADCLMNCGFAYSKQSNFNSAIFHYEKAATINQQLKRYELEAQCLHNAGSVYGLQGRSNELLHEYEKSLEFYNKMLSCWFIAARIYDIYEFNDIKRAILLSSLFSASAYISAIQKTYLIEYINRFLGMLPPNSIVRADFQIMLGELEIQRKNLIEAECWLNNGLIIYETYYRGTHGHANCLAQIGILYLNSNFSIAEERFAAATNIIESLFIRERHGLLRATDLFDKHQNAYRGLVRLFWRKGKYPEAFAYAEKLRARTLCDNMESKSLLAQLSRASDFNNTLTDTGSDIGESSKPATLTGKQIALHHQRTRDAYNEAHDQLYWLSARDNVVQAHAQWTQKAEAAATLLDALEAEAKARFSGAWNATQAVPETLNEVQGRLDSNTLLLSYTWQPDLSGDPKKATIYAWSVRGGEQATFLPCFINPENTFRIQQAINTLLGASSSVNAAETNADGNAPVPGQLWAKPTKDFPLLSSEGQVAEQTLANLLLYPLIRPDKPQIWENVQQIVIVPDGELFRLPFELLSLDEKHCFWCDVPVASSKSLPILGDIMPLTYIPSATMLGMQAAQTKQPANKQYFGIAASPDDAEKLEVAAEVEAVQAVFQASNDDRIIAPELTPGDRARMLHGVTECQFAHLAGHVLYDVDDPMASGLYLGTSPDGKKHSLTGYEFLARSVAANVFCLAGCRTGAGQYITGEGQIGLARCLLFAGADYAVVSLWQVDDEATRYFMEAFFQSLADGLAAPEAARRARLCLASDEYGYGHPKYKAAFIVVGSPPLIANAKMPDTSDQNTRQDATLASAIDSSQTAQNVGETITSSRPSEPTTPVTGYKSPKWWLFRRR